MTRRSNITKMPHNKSGEVIIPANAHPWPHEIRAAHILASVGCHVEFIPEENIKTPDIYLNHTPFEIKSPTSKEVKAVQRNLTRALIKCPNIVFDSSRMRVDDRRIYQELVKRLRLRKGLKKIIFLNKKREAIDINIAVKKR